MIRGGCLCGAVRYETAEASVFVCNCYCATCRRESGAGHLTVIVVPAAGFAMTGATKTVTLKRENDAPPIPRTFCAACGTTLYSQSSPSHMNIRAGTVDGVFPLQVQVSEWASQAQPWDRPPADVPTES
jgi:hypothetical protein